MRRLNVRCCCQPTKILGTLPWDERAVYVRFAKTGGGEVTLPVQEIKHFLTATIVPETASDDLLPERYAELIKREPAYKAEGAPLDQLRLIPEFREGECV